MHLPSLSWTLLDLASEWAIRITMLIYVPQRRSPAAARAWLLLIFFLPLPGILLYAAVGRIYVPRKRIALQRQASHLIRSVQAQMATAGTASPVTIPYAIAGVVQLASRLGDYLPVAGNSIELLSGYETPLARLIADIDAASQSIHLLYYIYEDDEVGQRVTTALLAAMQRGVQCRLLLDAVGSRRALRHLAPQLRAAGIEVIATMPVGIFRRNVARFDLRNHRKIVVIDGRLGYTGSQNIVNPEFIPGYPNEELVVRITGPVVSQLQGVFLADWYFETQARPREPELLGQAQETGTTVAQVLPSGPGYGRENTKELMIALIYSARHEVVIGTPYFVPDEPFMQALVSAAARGVATRLIVPLRSNQKVTHLAQQSYYAQLLLSGIEVHLFDGHFLHAKLMTVDNEVALIGSTNLDIRSFALNAEVSLLIYDADVVARLRAIYRDYMGQGHALDMPTWSKRSLPRKLLQNVARLADSLL